MHGAQMEIAKSDQRYQMETLELRDFPRMNHHLFTMLSSSSFLAPECPDFFSDFIGFLFLIYIVFCTNFNAFSRQLTKCKLLSSQLSRSWQWHGRSRVGHAILSTYFALEYLFPKGSKTKIKSKKIRKALQLCILKKENSKIAR